jgi:hypothetical protein
MLMSRENIGVLHPLMAGNGKCTQNQHFQSLQNIHRYSGVSHPLMAGNGKCTQHQHFQSLQNIHRYSAVKLVFKVKRWQHISSGLFFIL